MNRFADKKGDGIADVSMLLARQIRSLTKSALKAQCIPQDDGPIADPAG